MGRSGERPVRLAAIPTEIDEARIPVSRKCCSLRIATRAAQDEPHDGITAIRVTLVIDLHFGYDSRIGPALALTVLRQAVPINCGTSYSRRKPAYSVFGLISTDNGLSDREHMWFPSKGQWAVMWTGLIVLSFVIEDALDFDSRGWAGVFFVVVAIVFLVWMIEGRRRKSQTK
jgi:hypothetical protein